MSLPYFPMYPSDFEAKTSHLSIAEDGAYNRLLRICWMTPGCTLPNDEAWIMRRVRAHSDQDKEAVLTVLAEFFTVKNGRLSNARLSREWVSANEAHIKRVSAGSRGGKAKALNRNDNGSSNVKAKPKQPEPEPEPEPVKRDTSVSPKKRACAIPENWVPSDKNVDQALSKGLSEQEISHEADRFRDYHLAKGTTFKDWDAGWRTWCGNAVKHRGSRMAGQQGPSGYGQGSSIASIVARRHAGG